MAMGSTPMSMAKDSLAALTERVKPHIRSFLVATVALTVLLAVLRAWVCWANDRYFEFSAGVYVALAADLKNGVFYRPLFGPSGYGGTRYFPLYFVLYSLLLKLGLPVLFSGYLLSAAAIVLLIVGAFSVMRGLGAEPWLAACSAGAILAAWSVQWSLLSPHADGLACALNVCGLAVSARQKPNHGKILLASILFTLAWSTKVTTIAGFAATFFWLLFAGSSRMAWVLAAETACGYLAVIGAIVVASQGRILSILKAAAGSPSRVLVVAGPLRMLNTAAREDPGLLLFLFLACLALSVKSLRNLPTLFFIGAIVVTAGIFGFPGTNWNQLLDVQVAAVILFTSWLASKGAPLPKELGIYALALATLLAALPTLHKLRDEDRMLPAHRFEGAIALIGDRQKPILAENPALPVLAGQRPYVIDPWTLRLVAQRTPGFGESLLEALRHQAFSGVVLSMRDPRSDEGQQWYENDDFGAGFLSTLKENYRLASVLGGQFIYLPNADASRPNGGTSILEHPSVDNDFANALLRVLNGTQPHPASALPRKEP